MELKKYKQRKPVASKSFETHDKSKQVTNNTALFLNKRDNTILQKLKDNRNYVTSMQTAEKGNSGSENPIQRTSWSWVGGQWVRQDNDDPQTPAPNRNGTYDWETVDTAHVQEEQQQELEQDVGQLNPLQFNQYEWLFLLQNFLQLLDDVYPQNDPQPDGNYVSYKDQLQRPPQSGVKGSDHHTNTKGSGKKGRKVSSNQLKGDMSSKIQEVLSRLSIDSVPEFCKSPDLWDKWRKDHDPNGGGGGLVH